MSLDKYLLDPLEFVIECSIGEGNFSTVELVHPKSNKNIDYALKNIAVDLSDNDLQKYFIREVVIMIKLNHPCLIKFIGFALPSKDNQYFKIYSQYLPNKTLYDILKMDEEDDAQLNKLNATQRTKIIYGIASAMQYLHEKNIVHRDLKPENIFLNSKFEPVLSDFGLSKICSNDLTMTSKLGTPYFMAPELFYEDTEENQITNKIDVYSFAVTLLSIFQLNYKFNGNQPRTISQLFKYITNGKRFMIPEDIPKFYQNLISKCWSNNPNDRPSFNEIVQTFEMTDEFILDGADLEEVKEYIKMIKNTINSDEMSRSNGLTDLPEEEKDEFNEIEETKEFIFL